MEICPKAGINLLSCILAVRSDGFDGFQDVGEGPTMEFARSFGVTPSKSFLFK